MWEFLRASAMYNAVAQIVNNEFKKKSCLLIRYKGLFFPMLSEFCFSFIFHSSLSLPAFKFPTL
jgi:hypothetical protein